MSSHQRQRSLTRTWRVFYTRARAEKKCEEELERRGIEVFLPKCEVVRQWSDRKKKVIEPLFPNYIFAHVDERERLQVLRVEGIARCVSFGGRPATISNEEIEQLKITQNEPHRLSLVDVVMPEVGEEVEIKEAPLRGLKGRVLEHRGQMHVVVQVHAIQQAVRVNVPAAWVEQARAA